MEVLKILIAWINMGFIRNLFIITLCQAALALV